MLAGEPLVLVDDADAPVALVEVTGEQRGHVGCRDIAVPDPAAVGLDLDERLEPQHPA